MTIDGNRMIMSAIGKLFGLYMAVSVEFQMYAADRQMGGRQEWTWITESGNGLNRAFVLRKALDCGTNLSRAILRHTGLGVYEITVNGLRVGDVELKPGFTSPKVRESYVDDVTTLLKAGEKNVIEVEVSDSYWRDLIAGDPKRVGRRPNAVALSLRMEYQDGRVETVDSAPDWEVVSAHRRGNLRRRGVCGECSAGSFGVQASPDRSSRRAGRSGEGCRPHAQGSGDVRPGSVYCLPG